MSQSSRLVPAASSSIAYAAALLREGKLVAFPTETVYGLGGDATNDKAVAAIYAAKGRPEFNPLIIHVAGCFGAGYADRMERNGAAAGGAVLAGAFDACSTAQKGLSGFWAVGKRRDGYARCQHQVFLPHPVARQLLRETGKPIAAPSANLSGKLSPTTPLHVAESLGDKVDLILAGGKSEVGLESTVVDLVSPQPRILRPGGVTKEQLEYVIGPLSIAAETDTPFFPPDNCRAITRPIWPYDGTRTAPRPTRRF